VTSVYPLGAAQQDAASQAAATLRLAGTGDPDHLDPVCIAHPATAQLARLSTRSLFGYVGDPDPLSWRPVTPAADLAAMVPSIYNAGIGASHRSVVVQLRPGVRWDTTPHRAVTAQDVVRGLKRLGNPVHRPAALAYFTSMIRGMAEFCAGYAEAVTGANPSPDELAAYQNEHDIAGVFALDDETVVFELTRPALDLPHLLALPCAAPAPVEYDAFLPGSPALRSHLRSTGPYRPLSTEPDQLMRWEPNPAWRAETDPLRSRHLSSVELAIEPTSPARLAQRIRAGEIDLAWGVSVTDRPWGEFSHDPSWSLDPYLVLNTRSPRANAAIRDVAARRAIASAIDHTVRTEMAQIASLAEPGRLARAATSLIPWSDGCPSYAQAGADIDSTLLLVHARTGIAGPIARVCEEALERAGIAMRLVELEDAEFRRVVHDADREAWDIAVDSRHPEWMQHGERVFVQPFVERCADAGPPIARALDAAAEPAAAAESWRKAEQRVLDHAAVVPLLFRAPCAAPLASERVHGVVTMPLFAHEVDLTALQFDRRA
jgi:peptide/nickel transport system substrate-binding protein